MPNHAHAVIMGHVTKGGKDKPAVFYSAEDGQTPYASFTVVVFLNQRKPKSKEYEDVPMFFRIKVYGKRAEFCKKFLHEKTAVLIVANPRVESYYDRDTGEKIEGTSWIAQSVDFAGSKNDNSGGGRQSDDADYEAHSSPDDFDVGDLGPAIDYDNDPGDPMETPGN